MPRFELTLDVADIRRTLTAMADRARDLRPAMQNIAEMLKASTDLRFETESDPDSNAWAKVSPATAARKRAAGHERILQWSGRLRRSIEARVDPLGVTLGTNLVYSAIHQFGGTLSHGGRVVTIYRKTAKDHQGNIYVKNRFVKKSRSNFASDHWKSQNTITMPARRFLGISDGDVNSGLQILRSYITAGAK